MEIPSFPRAFLFLSYLMAQVSSWMEKSEVMLGVGDCFCSYSVEEADRKYQAVKLNILTEHIKP